MVQYVLDGKVFKAKKVVKVIVYEKKIDNFEDEVKRYFREKGQYWYLRTTFFRVFVLTFLFLNIAV